MATLADALPKSLGDSILKLLKTQTRDSEHFEKNYKLVNSESKPSRGSFGKIDHVRCTVSGAEYAIKTVVIKEESNKVVYNMFLQTLQECVLHGLIGPHANLVKAYPELNWLVLPEHLDALEVTDVLEQGTDIPLSHLRRFIGTEVYMVFDWYPDDLMDLMQCEEDVSGADCKTIAILSRADSKQVLLHILLGLYWLHTKGVIHNDVKPDNILLRHYQPEQQQLEAVITDLGLTRLTEPCLATSIRRFKRHRYDAPDPNFTTKIDIWSFGMLAFHLTFVAITRKRMSATEFGLIHHWAKHQDSNALRRFIGNKLQNENPFFVESIVQCLQIIPKYRPTARAMCEILLGGNLYVSACNAACLLHNLIGLASICLEEMIFAQWYQHVFLVQIISSGKFAKEIVGMLVRFGELYDFPLIAVIENYEIEMHRFADVLKSAFAPAQPAICTQLV